jgi:hypothetical protein
MYVMGVIGSKFVNLLFLSWGYKKRLIDQLKAVILKPYG